MSDSRPRRGAQGSPTNTIGGQPAAEKKRYSKEEKQRASNGAAMAVIGGRFPDGGVKEALAHTDFAGASSYYTYNAVLAMEGQAEAVLLAEGAEVLRKRGEAEERLALAKASVDPAQAGDAAYVRGVFDDLKQQSEAGVVLLPGEMQLYTELFSKLDAETQRTFAFEFQYASWAGEVERASAAGKSASGNLRIRGQAVVLFGEKAAYSTKSIRNRVKSGQERERHAPPCLQHDAHVSQDTCSSPPALSRTSRPRYVFFSFET